MKYWRLDLLQCPSTHFPHCSCRILEGPEEGVSIPFPSPFYLEIPFPTAQIPILLQKIGKNPSVIQTSFFAPRPQNYGF